MHTVAHVPLAITHALMFSLNSNNNNNVDLENLKGLAPV